MGQVYGDRELFGQLFPSGETARSVHESLGFTTRDAVTLAVNGGTGSDTPTDTRPALIVEGDHSAEPFETIQAAIDALPKNIVHAVQVSVAEGNYTGFQVKGYHCADGSGIASTNLTIQGTTALATLTTGTASGTATGGGGRTLVDTGQSWTVNELRGMFVNVTGGTGSGQYLVVESNTADTITFVQIPSPAFASGSVYEIREGKTIINSANPAGGGILVASHVGRIDLVDFVTTGTTFGLVGIGVQGRFVATRVHITGSYYGFVLQDSLRMALNQIAVFNSTSSALNIVNVGHLNINSNFGWLIDTSGDLGLNAYACNGVNVTGLTVSGCTGYSVYIGSMDLAELLDVHIDGGSYGVVAGGTKILFLRGDVSNCGNDGVFLDNANLSVTTALSGTGNGRWGVYGFMNSSVELRVTPTITGTSGDTTVDQSTPLVWATDLNDVGEGAVNHFTGSRIARTY